MSDSDNKPKFKVGDYLRGGISPAWMRSNIRAGHGDHTEVSLGQLAKEHIVGNIRAGVRGAAEAVVGGGLGALSGGAMEAILTKGRHFNTGAQVGHHAGLVVGSIHGGYESLRNQAREEHQKYAALDDLVNNQGVDFDEAVRQILGE